MRGPDKGNGIISRLSSFTFGTGWFLFLVLLINIVGIAYGFYYYRLDLQEFPAYLWIILADSPIAVLFFSLFLTLFLLGKRNGLIEALAFFGGVKVGFWTVFIILLYNSYFLQPLYFSWYFSLLVLHLGMVLETIVMVPIMKISRTHVMLASAFYLLNDIADYFFNLVPRRDIILGSSQFPLVAAESFLVTIILSYFLLKFSSKN